MTSQDLKIIAMAWIMMAAAFVVPFIALALGM